MRCWAISESSSPARERAAAPRLLDTGRVVRATQASGAAQLVRATLSKSPADVAEMFDGVARRYDRTNDVLSLGRTRGWRAAVRGALDLRAGDRVLDLAAGTATSSVAFARSGAQVVAVDFSLGMLGVGRERLGAASTGGVHLLAGDGLRLPFRPAAFSAVTVSFGLRNVADPDACLAELRRVVRPGGVLVVCEFSSPTWRPFRALYGDYLVRALPPVARAVSSNPAAYAYLAESIAAWPDQEALARRIAAAGWAEVRWRDLTGGIVALHRARA